MEAHLPREHNMMKSLFTSVLLLALLCACTTKNSTGSSIDKVKFAANLKVGLLITTGGKGGDLAGPSIGAANVAAAHLSADAKSKVEVEQVDYQGDLNLVPQLASELAAKSDVLIIGTDDPAVLPALTSIQIPMIHPYITADSATAGGNVFRLAARDSIQSARLASYLINRRKLSRVGVLFENTEYGKAGSTGFEEAVKSSGGSIVSFDGFDPGGDIHTPISAANDAGAKALVIWTDNPAEAARIIIDVHRSSFSYQLAVPGNAAVPQFGKNAVAQVVPTAFREGILSVGPWAGPWTNSQRIKRFYSDFESKQNDLAPVRTAQVYDAVLVAAAAKTSSNLADGLMKLKDFVGASVPITFDSQREGMDESDVWAWGFTKSKTGAGAEFFPAVDTGGGFFTLIPAGLQVPTQFRYLIQ